MPRRSADAEGAPNAAPTPKPRRRSTKPRTPDGAVDHVRVSDGALATVIGLAAHEVPGVVGMAPTSLTEGLRRILGVSQVDEGVEVERSEDGATARVVLHVVVAYGYDGDGVYISDPATGSYRFLSWDTYAWMSAAIDGMSMAVYPS